MIGENHTLRTAGLMFTKPDMTGYVIVCEGCKHKHPDKYQSAQVPIYQDNLGNYKQPCYECGRELNPAAHPKWPVLFDGK